MNKKPPYRKQPTHEITGAKVEVRNGDVNGALRRLKKILEGADRQKELSKREFFEKPSITRKRNKAAAKKRTQKEERNRQSTGTANKVTGVQWMKSKRKRRRILDQDAALVSYKRGK